MPIIGNSFRVCIHDFDHSPPHCHVYCKDGVELVITLPLLEEIFKKKIKKEIRKFLEDHLDELVDEWEEKNPNKYL